MSGLYIRKFIDRLQQAELKGQKDFVCPLADAKNLHNDITRLLLDLEAVNQAAKQPDKPVTVELEGGAF